MRFKLFSAGKSNTDHTVGGRRVAAPQEDLMADLPTDFQIGDRVQYIEGTVSWGARKGQIGTVTAIYSDGTSGPSRADVQFDDEIERDVSIALLELA